MQKLFPPKQIDIELQEGLSRNDLNLVISDLPPGHRAARRNEMRSPLEDEAQIPQDKKAHPGGQRGHSGVAPAKQRCQPLEKRSQTQHEKNGERDKEAVPVG